MIIDAAHDADEWWDMDAIANINPSAINYLLPSPPLAIAIAIPNGNSIGISRDLLLAKPKTILPSNMEFLLHGKSKYI